MNGGTGTVPVRRYIREILVILLGSLLTAAAFQLLMYPNSIVTGGITGIAQIVNMLTGFPIGVATILMNIPLFLLAWRKMGRQFVVYSLVCMLALSVFIDLLAMIPVSLTIDPMLAAVYGGVLYGAGLGVVYTTGATGGGMDIPARLLRRRFPHINFGVFSLAMNGVIIVAFAVIFHKIESCMYAVICAYISSKLMDVILYGPITSRLCYIISDKSDDLKDAITSRLGRGATLLQGHGAWSGKEKQVILCVVKSQQIASLRRLVRDVDAQAFLVVSDARGVYGSGFESIGKED